MGQMHESLTQELQNFIKQQQMFFVATATKDSSINLSPKGISSLKIINDKRLIWLNMTGSGNESSSHIQEDGRMTIMLNSFSEKALILRMYGQAKAIHGNDNNWDELYSLFTPIVGARQIFDLSIDKIKTSCGEGVPIYEYIEQRTFLVDWAIKKGEEGIKEYQKKKNTTSIDGKIINL